jgi:hypothetical protein
MVGIVYKLWNDRNEVYIGSTYRPVKQRFAEHKKSSPLFQGETVVYCEEVASCLKDDKTSLRLLEKDILSQYPNAVNKACPIVLTLREKYDRKNIRRRDKYRCPHCDELLNKNSVRLHIKVRHEFVELGKKLNLK